MGTIIRLASIYCLYILCCACSENTQQIHNDATYIIDVDSAEDRDVFYLSSIVKSVRPILLEEPDYALIGECDKIEIFDNNIFLLDRFVARKLFVYDMNGKFLRQIGSFGPGPDEYRGILDFCIDSEKKEIHFYEYWNNKLLTYNINNGKHLQTRYLPHGDISYSDISYSDGKIYTALKHDNPDERGNMLVKIDLKTGKHTEYLDADKYCGTNLYRIISTPPDCLPKYGGYYMNTIFVCRNDSVYPHVFVKSRDCVQKRNVSTTEDNDEYLKNKGFVFGVNRYFENDTCIYFRYQGGKNEYQIVYNKQKQLTCRYQSIMNDVDYNLQTKKRNPDYYAVYTVNSKYAYNITPSNVVSLWLENGVLSPELEKQIKQLKLEEEGYVVFEYELK